MKIGFAQYIGVRFIIGTLFGLGAAAFILWQAIEIFNSNDIRFAGNDLAADVQKSFSNEYNNLIHELRYVDKKEFRRAVAEGDKLATVGHLISMTNEILPREVMLYVNRGNDLGWVNSGEFFDLGDTSTLIKSIEPILEAGRNIASLSQSDDVSSSYLLASSPIQAIDSFNMVGELRAVFEFGEESNLLNSILKNSGSDCIVLIPKQGNLLRVGDPECIENVLSEEITESEQIPELRGKWITSGYIDISKSYNFAGRKFIAARSAKTILTKMEYANITIIFIGGFIVLSGVLVTFFVGAKIRRDIQALVNYVGRDSKKTLDEKPYFQIIEFQRILDSYDSAQNRLLAEQQTREEAEGNVQRLHGELSSAQSEKMQALGHLTAGVAHDFNNLLAIISVGVSQLEDNSYYNSGSPKEAVVEAISRATLVVRDLLYYARNDTNLVEVNDLSDIVRRVEKIMRAAIGPEIRLETQVNPEMDYLVKIDTGKCFSAITNLVKNAQDAMPNGGYLTLSLEKIDAEESAREGVSCEHGACVVAVKDTGQGIPEDLLPLVLRPYFTTKKKMDGTGLGLSLTDNFISDSGGKMKIFSQPGIGTHVRLILPCTNEILISSGTTLSKTKTTLEKKKQILLVEDEISLAKMTKFGLERMKIDVDAVYLISEALERLKVKKYDCVITDLQLPDGNGSEILEAIEKSQNIISVIVLSGNPTAEEIEEFSRRPFTSVYLKPISIAELAQAVYAN